MCWTGKTICWNNNRCPLLFVTDPNAVVTSIRITNGRASTNQWISLICNDHYLTFETGTKRLDLTKKKKENSFDSICEFNDIFIYTVHISWWLHSYCIVREIFVSKRYNDKTRFRMRISCNVHQIIEYIFHAYNEHSVLVWSFDLQHPIQVKYCKGNFSCD